MSTPSAAARSLPRSISFGVRSEATTLAPSAAASSAKLPVPAPTSSTSCPAETAHASISAWLAGSVSLSIGE